MDTEKAAPIHGWNCCLPTFTSPGNPMVAHVCLHFSQKEKTKTKKQQPPHNNGKNTTPPNNGNGFLWVPFKTQPTLGLEHVTLMEISVWPGPRRP